MSNQGKPHLLLSLWKRQLVIVALLVLTRCLGLYAISTDAAAQSRTSMRALKLPATIGGWNGVPVKVDPVVYEVLRPDAVVQKRYTLNAAKPVSSNPAQVETIVIYSHDVRGFHSPDMCLTTQGWVITDTQKRQVGRGDQSIELTVLTAEKARQKSYLAYFFGDTQQRVTGWVPTLVNLVGARLLRRRVGAMQIQFAYDARSLQPDGEFTPQLRELMVNTAKAVAQPQ